MKKFTLILVLFSFLCANTELRQFLKLPILIHHFLSHHQSNNRESFVQFLSEHYSLNTQHTQDHHPEHDKLPFKTSDCGGSHSIVVINQIADFSIAAPVFEEREVLVVFAENFYSSTDNCNIWQPPKLV